MGRESSDEVVVWVVGVEVDDEVIVFDEKRSMKDEFKLLLFKSLLKGCC